MNPYTPGRYRIVRFLNGSFYNDEVARKLFVGQEVEVIRTTSDHVITVRFVGPLTGEMEDTSAYQLRIRRNGTMSIANPELIPVLSADQEALEAWCEYDQQEE